MVLVFTIIVLPLFRGRPRHREIASPVRWLTMTLLPLAVAVPPLTVTASVANRLSICPRFKVRVFCFTVISPLVAVFDPVRNFVIKEPALLVLAKALTVAVRFVAVPVSLFIVMSLLLAVEVFGLHRAPVLVIFGTRYFARVRVYRNVWTGRSLPLEVVFLPPL